MGSKHFEQLDTEARALSDSSSGLARMGAYVALISIIVWAVCTALREAIHVSVHAVLGGLDEGAQPEAFAILFGALLLGGLIRAVLYRFPSWRLAAGDGMDSALSNFHVTYEQAGDNPRPRYDRPDLALAGRKSVVTWLTLGSGASGGLEAPTVMIAENLAAGISRLLRIRSEYELRNYQLAAISAAVATLLNAPFTAALFATEVAYGNKMIYRQLAYSLWAGVIAYWLNAWMRGAYQPIFTAPVHAPTYSLAELGGATLVGVAVSVPLALGFGLAMSWVDDLVKQLRPAWHPPVTVVAAGVLAIGLWWVFGLRPVHVLGTGEEMLAALMTRSPEVDAWWLLLVALVGKMLTTGLTLAGGGSAGLLVPSMYLGGVAGALVAHLVNLFAGLGLDPALYAVVGISASLVGVVGVPLAAIALAFEVFGKAFGPPAILACGLTYLLTLRVKVYSTQRNAPPVPPEPPVRPATG